MTNDFSWTSRSTGGPQYYEPNWSGFMNAYNIGGSEPGTYNVTRTYSWTITFNNYGRQKFWTAVDDYGYVYINGAYQFQMGGFGGQSSRTTPGYFSPGTYTISATSVNSGGGPYGVALDWYGYDPPPAPSITSFYANPNPQNSVSGTPLYSTTLNWNTSGVGISNVTITSSIGESWNVGTSGTLNITNLPQSNADGTSPAQRTYYISATNGGGTRSSNTTVSVRNDNTPTNSWTTSFINLEPNTQTTVDIGTLSGVDMPTTISTSGVGNFVGLNNSFSGSRDFSNGQTVRVRITSAPFNTDVSGLPPNATFGKTNDKVVPITTPTGTFNVTFQTRAPQIAEGFDFEGNDTPNTFPDPDIDLITNNPFEYVITNQVDIDNIEISQEIKADDPDIQVSINNGTWQNVREI